MLQDLFSESPCGVESPVVLHVYTSVQFQFWWFGLSKWEVWTFRYWMPTCRRSSGGQASSSQSIHHVAGCIKCQLPCRGVPLTLGTCIPHGVLVPRSPVGLYVTSAVLPVWNSNHSLVILHPFTVSVPFTAVHSRVYFLSSPYQVRLVVFSTYNAKLESGL